MGITLGDMQGLLRVAQQNVRLCGIARLQGDPDARSQHDLIVTDAYRLCRGTQQSLRHLGYFVHICRSRHQNRECIAANAPQRIAAGSRAIGPGTQSRAQSRGYRLQRQITGGSPQRVVHTFEAVDIQQQHGAADTVFPRKLQPGSEQFLEVVAVWQSSQCIVRGQLLNTSFGFHPVGDVLGDAFHAQWIAARIIQHQRLFVDCAQRAVGAPHHIHLVITDASC
jgi:hypothetical protein